MARNNKTIIIIVGAAILLVGIVGLIIALNSGDDNKPTNIPT